MQITNADTARRIARQIAATTGIETNCQGFRSGQTSEERDQYRP